MQASVSWKARARRSTLLAVAGLYLLAASGCISTALIDQWKDPSYQGPALHKVLVVGVQKDQGSRRVWESSMVSALQAEGIEAMPSYQVYPSKAPTAAQLAQTARHDGFDGVLATHFVRASNRLYWMPGWAGFGFGWRWRYFGYWNTVYGPGNTVYGPGYVEARRNADYQTDVFAINNSGGMLIWTGITRSVNLSSLHSTTHEISEVLVPELLRDHILARRPRGS